MRAFLEHILSTYGQRPARLVVAQKHPQYIPFAWWELDGEFIDKAVDINQRKDVFISPRFGNDYVFHALDLDKGLPDSFDEQPTYLTRTSPNHYQAIWFCDPLPAQEWITKQRKLKRRYRADAGCCFEYVARIPASYSFKRQFQTEVL